MKNALLLFAFVLALATAQAQPRTYCNPINLDYGYTPIPNF
jgi:xylan 1,4-beta-xylosidase